MTPVLRLRLLGCPELRTESSTETSTETARLLCSDTSLRILAVLALDGPQERLKLADLLWDGPTERVLHNLRMALLKLRRSLGSYSDVLRDQNQFLRLDLGRVQVDALNPPLHAHDLLHHWREFMSGQRCKGSENWLEWANHQEERLLKAHLQQLQALASVVPSLQQQDLERQFGYLMGLLYGTDRLSQPIIPDESASHSPMTEWPTSSVFAWKPCLEALNPDERAVLRLAALCDLPHPFSIGLACDVLNKPEQVVLDAVESLYQQGYLVGCGVHPPTLQAVVLAHMPEPTRLHWAGKIRQNHYGHLLNPAPASNLKN